MGGLSFGMDMSMNMGGGFSPFAVGQPIVLFDAALGITLNGADVSGWADQSGNGNDVTQATAADQPLWNAADANLNGQPSVTGDGVSEFLRSAAFAVAKAQPNTVISVYYWTALAQQDVGWDGVTARNLFIKVNAANAEQIFAGTIQTIQTADLNPHVLATIFNGALSDSYKDGTQGTPAGNPGTAAMDGTTLFSNVPLSEFGALTLAWQAAWNKVLSTTELNYIGNGLAGRFGTTWTDI